MQPDHSGSRLRRWLALVRLAGSRLLGRSTGGLNRLVLAVAVVAFTIALLVVVTGISVNLADRSTASGAVDYRITPESGTSLSSVVAVGEPRLGDVHETTDEIESVDGVTGVTPVLVDIVQIRAPETDEPEYILAVGVIPPDEEMQIAGLSTGTLVAGDSSENREHGDQVAGGEPETQGDEPITQSDVVLSTGAAAILNASVEDELVVRSTATGEIQYSGYEVAAVEDTETPGGETPVALLSFRDLQSLAGAAEEDHANQFLVQTDSTDVQSELEDVCPDATVLEEDGLNPEQVLDSDLPLAMAVTAMIVTIVVAGLFIATTMGLAVESDRQQLAVLAAIGLSRRSRMFLVVGMTLTLTVVGGLLGVLLGIGGVALTNALATTLFGYPEIAAFHPLIGLYTFGIAVLTGLLSVVYPVVVARQTPTSEVLSR